MRESARDKAGRYLLEGRVIVTRVDRRGVVAKVRGEGNVWTTWWQSGEWCCDCPHTARTTWCCHILAVQRVTAVEVEGRR